MFSGGWVGGRGGYRKDRSRQRRCSVKVKKGVLKNFINFTGKHEYLSLFLIKLQIRCSLQHKCFLVTFVNYIGTPILKNISK